MWVFVVLAILALLLLIIFGLITYARWNFGSLEKQGFTVVQPQDFLLGSALLSYEKNGGLLDIEHMKKYGPVFGLYEGREPQIFICCPELIRVVTTRDAEYFNAKRFLDFGDPIMNEMPDFQPYEKWKMIRSMITPVINSSVRLKNSGPVMRETVKGFVDEIKKQIKDSGGKLEKYQLNLGLYGMLTDMIARSQYSVSIGKPGDNRFAKIIQTLFVPPAVQAPWIAAYIYAFPFLKKLLPNTLINPEPVAEFVQLINELMDMRRKQNKASGTQAKGHARDFLDYLLEWYDDLKSNPDYKKNDITDKTIYNFGLGMFIAGQDQLSLIISALMYYVSVNKEIEKRLQEEVDRVWNKTGVFDHETLSEMTYMNACISEASRLYPFFFRTERVCTKDWEDASRGIRIKKGNVVQIPIWATNRNPEYWDDPEEFKPERFLPENRDRIHPYAFSSFGFGPRSCAGKRFSFEIAGIVTAYLMKELQFVRTKDTKINFLPTGPFFAMAEPIVFDVVMKNPIKKEE